MTDVPPEKQARRLDSWKEIAEYLGYDLRTVMRWEQQRGLPVHRVPGGKRQAVFALNDELDAWLMKQGTEASRTESAASEAVSEISTPSPNALRARSFFKPAVAVGVCAVLLLGWVYFVRPGSGRSPAAIVSLPREVRFEGEGFSLQYVRSAFDPGIAPYAGQAGDLNEDGFPDLVFAGSPSDVIGVLIGKGDGTLQPARVFERCPQADRVRLVDLNRDGHLDIAATCTLGDKLVVLWGKGDGTFPARTEVPIAGGPRLLAVGDLDGDGWTDLAVCAYTQANLFVVRNDRGTFVPSLLAHFQAVASPAIMDWDSDGRPDVVAGVQSKGKEGLAVFLGKGNGAFRPPAFHEWPEMSRMPLEIIPVDLDRDGWLDLVISTWTGDLMLLRGLGKGEFAPPRRLIQTGGVLGTSVADLDLDGKLDILNASWRRGTLAFLRNDGDGAFSAAREVPLGNFPAFPLVADFNRDGLPDVAVNLWRDRQVTVLLAHRKQGAGP